MTKGFSFSPKAIILQCRTFRRRRPVSKSKHCLVPHGQGQAPHPFRIRDPSGFFLWWQMPSIFPKLQEWFSEERFRSRCPVPMGLSLWCLFDRFGSCHLRTSTTCFAWLCSAQMKLYFPFHALLRKMMPVAETQGESLLSIDPHFPLRCLIFSLSVPQVRGEQAEKPLGNTMILFGQRCFSSVISCITVFRFATYFCKAPQCASGLELTVEPFPSFTRTVRAQNQTQTGVTKMLFSTLSHLGSVFKEQSVCLVALI